jgi:homoserine O-acetyltransferase
VGEGWYTERAYERAGYASADGFVEHSYLPAFADCDADDLLAQLGAWREAGAALPAGSLAEALASVRAKVLLMPCDTDKYFTLAEARREAEALGDRAILSPIISPAGHRAGDAHRPELSAERTHITKAVRALLAENP